MPSLYQQNQDMSLTLQALNQILDNQVTESYTFPHANSAADTDLNSNATSTTTTVSYHYIAPCHTATVQESTSTLLAAQALAKSNRFELAWETLRSFFVVQGKNGFLPKYRFAAEGPTNTPAILQDVTSYNTQRAARDDSNTETIDIPTRDKFGPLPNFYQPCPPSSSAHSKDPSCYDAHNALTYTSLLQIQSSGRLSALPLHASVVLDIFLASSQRMDDIVQLEFYWHRLYSWHQYWMEEILGSSACRLAGAEDYENGIRDTLNSTMGCYNVIHPWESLEGVDSPLWENALRDIIAIMEKSNWTTTPPSSLHSSNRHITSTPGQNAMTYLLQCHKNIATHDDNYTTWTTHMYERHLLSQCPFAMLDLSHLSILQRSNMNLLEIGILLQELHSNKKPTRVQFRQMEEWIQRGRNLLEVELWNEERNNKSGGKVNKFNSRKEEEDWERGYFSEVLEFDHLENNDTGTLGPYVYNSSRTLLEPTLTNLLVSWNSLIPSRFQESIISPLLERRGKFRFDCPLDMYPVPVWGECPESNSDSNHRVVDPVLNYFLASGLEENGAKGLGGYIQNSTLRLVCNHDQFLDSKSSTYNADSFCPNATFAPFFTTAGDPSIDSTCPCLGTSTMIAAVTYNILSSSNKVPFRPPPPIQQSWVLLLIVVELTVAFTIGLSCLLVSLNLMRRLHPVNPGEEVGDEGTDQHTFLHLLRERDINFGETLYEETEEELEEEENNGEFVALVNDPSPTVEVLSTNLRRVMTFLNPF